MYGLQRRLVLLLRRGQSLFLQRSSAHSGDRQLKQFSQGFWLALGTVVLIVLSASWLGPIAALESAQPPLVQIIPSGHLLAQPTTPSPALPPLQVHSLPSTLASWRDRSNQGDYFDQIQPLPIGALIWSQFPIKVYVESPVTTISTGATAKPESPAQVWTRVVTQAVTEWQAYLPLQLVNRPEQADITIWRSPPPLTKGGPKPSDRNYRVRSAETRYELYPQQTGNASPVLSHRCKIWLRPSQTAQYIQAAARHELGHALGLWGHSPLQTDALYFSQVRQPAAISPRDISTLKRVYQQPTRLGWPLPAARPPLS